MNGIAGLITQFGPWLWFALAVSLFVLETLVPGIHFLWFGLAAGIVGVVALLAPITWQWQLILYALISVATVFWMRRYMVPEQSPTDEPVLNVRGAQYIGRRVEVVEAIRNGRGKVRVGDTQWAAEGEDAAKGDEVEVTGVNGTVLVVVRLDV
jgi:membrane protein implicated in regulation of membrane protease activity